MIEARDLEAALRQTAFRRPDVLSQQEIDKRKVAQLVLQPGVDPKRYTRPLTSELRIQTCSLGFESV
jgi:hypothetical protein